MNLNKNVKINSVNIIRNKINFEIFSRPWIAVEDDKKINPDMYCATVQQVFSLDLS